MVFFRSLKDLMSNQIGMPTSFFGANIDYGLIPLNYPFLRLLDSNYLYSLDEQLYGKNYQKVSHIFESFHEEIFHNPMLQHHLQSLSYVDRILYKVDLMNRYLLNIGRIQGANERDLYYDFLIRLLFNKKERKFISSNLLDNGDVEIVVLMPAMENPIRFLQIGDLNSGYSLKRVC